MNNRQGNRRRGRNNGARQNRGGDNGNRIDNRARGNAAQLLEKYKNLARDAQMQGDRVQTEYYLQFADHYFRVLNDVRQRQEEQQRQRQEERTVRGVADGVDMEDDGYDQRAEAVSDSDGSDEQGASDMQRGQRDGGQRRDRRPRRDTDQRGVNGYRQAERGSSGEDDTHDDDDAPGFDAALLPPSLAASVSAEDRSAANDRDEDQDAPAKPRRGRPRKSESASEIAS